MIGGQAMGQGPGASVVDTLVQATNAHDLDALVACFPETMTEIVAALETYDSPIDMAGMAATFGVTPTPVHDFIHGFLGASGRTRG
jgi:hypothetical protein